MLLGWSLEVGEHPIHARVMLSFLRLTKARLKNGLLAGEVNSWKRGKDYTAKTTMKIALNVVVDFF